MLSIIDRIQGLNLKGFEGFSLSKILFLSSSLVLMGSYTSRGLFFDSFRLVKALFFKDWILKWRFESSATKLFVYGFDQPRSDLFELFINVTNLASRKDIVFCEYVSGFISRIDFLFGVKMLPYVLSWSWSLRTTNLTFFEKIVVLKEIVKVFKFYSEFKRLVSLEKYRLLTVFFDADAIHSFIAQMFRHKGCKVATLQHGVVISGRENLNNVDFLGLELKNSISDYFLAWNKFTLEEALRAGMDSSRIRVVGVSKCIQFENAQIASTAEDFRRGVFGVILDGRFTAENNVIMIQLANRLATRTGLKFILKFHPAFKGDEYDNIVDFNCLERKCLFGGRLQEYTTEVDFSMVCNSTVLIELVYLRQPVVRYAPCSATDKYERLDCNKFDDYEGLESIVEGGCFSEVVLYDQLISVSNISEAHRLFFREFD